MKVTGSSPPAPARNSTARLRQPTMAMAGAPRTWKRRKRRVSIASWSSSMVSVPTSDSSLPHFMRVINLFAPRSYERVIAEPKVFMTSWTEMISSMLGVISLATIRLHYHDITFSAYGTFLHSDTHTQAQTCSSFMCISGETKEWNILVIPVSEYLKMFPAKVEHVTM